MALPFLYLTVVLSAMIPGLFGLQKVQEIYNISAIGWPFPRVRTVARSPLPTGQ
jgi:hypothetical protein